MSRFGNLEFDEEFGGTGAKNQAVKDEAYYSAEALAAFQRADFEGALRLYSKVIEHNPGNAGAWAGQARMLVELEEYREARLWAEKALERFPRDPELLAARAVALARSGDHEAAIVFSDAAAEERGDTPYVWLARGDVLLASGEARAAYCFEKALMLASGDWFIRWLAGRIHFFHKRFALALKYFQEAIERNSVNFVVWFDLGRCQEALGLLRPAELSFRQARELNPQCLEARHRMATLARAGFWPRAAGWIRAKFHR
ncbi:MAG TPA: tetratricopeptide repeat protein [Verrucomicrobiae bacterium]|nr:tetratricopeptide repeat protein [Verrucomicrobiae bacterium]